MVDLVRADMFVNVLSAPKGRLIKNAWKHSRPNDIQQPWADVAAIDVPVNELEDFVLEMFVPIAIREIIFTMRDHVAWARTSRVDNLNEWPIYPDMLFFYQPEIKALAAIMETKMATGSDQDNFRMLLPLCYMTHFTLKISARSLVKLTQFFAKASLDYDHVPLVASLFKRIGKQLLSAMEDTPYMELARDNRYQPIDLFSKDFTPIVSNTAVVLGGVMVMRVAAVPMALRAQLVRHRPLSIRDNLHTYMYAGGLARPIADPVDIELAMTVQMAISLVKKRNCWISQDDLWRPVLDTINKALGRQDAALILPCNGCNACPIARDNSLRYHGDDPAPPCPIWMKLTKHAWANDQQREDAYRFAERRGHSDWWKLQADQVN